VWRKKEMVSKERSIKMSILELVVGGRLWDYEDMELAKEVAHSIFFAPWGHLSLKVYERKRVSMWERSIKMSKG
jgi:hypothetical protein